MQFRFPFLPAGICVTMAHLIENSRFSFFDSKRVWITLFRACPFRCVRILNGFCTLSYVKLV